MKEPHHVSADVTFEIHHRFRTAARAVWDALVDWEDHANWIPATRVEVGEGDPTEPGTTFTAWTGVRPLALKDVMRVEACAWSESDRRGTCVVEKLGPVLTGRAGFTVSGDADHAAREGFEDVTVRWAPSFLGPLLSWLGTRGFRYGIGRLERRLAGDTSG